MNTEVLTLKPIGVIRSEHTDPERTPIQPVFAKGCVGCVEVFPEYADGLRDIEGFSHLYILYAFHRASPCRLTVKPFLQDVEHGVFATRAPCRPNPIGLSVVRLDRREGNVLCLDGVDILDGTPLLDIKPYTARFDRIDATKSGWQDDVDEETVHQRGRREKDKEAVMPRGDGTGPGGKGTGTDSTGSRQAGRGCGPCGGGQRKGPAAGAGKGQGRGRGGRGQGAGGGRGLGRGR